METPRAVRPLPLPAVIPVAGVSFRQDVVRSVAPGLPVMVVPDPSNPRDANAHAIVTVDGRLLGYVPQALLPRLLARRAASFDGRIDDVLKGETWGLRVEVLAASDLARRAPTAAISSEPASDEQAVAPAASGSVPVRSRSGRTLGTFERREGRMVHVRVGGSVVPFPSAAVTVGDAAP
jgi:hypothetical protein